VARYHLSLLYHEGKGAAKDKKKQVYRLEKAAIGGHLDARYNLGCVEGKRGSRERATKHLIIAANLGHDGARTGGSEGRLFERIRQQRSLCLSSSWTPGCRRWDEKSQRDEAEARRTRHYLTGPNKDSNYANNYIR
jgi:hypothetical protein